MLFETVLVANRGEIACRIIETLARLGIRSVAVYSDADRGAKHVAMADTAVHIGAATPQASYLNIDALVAAARVSGADAIHPGYGFLSENAAFATACADAGIVFIGPGVHALEVMGDKIRAKNHVRDHGVPVIAGIAEPGLSDKELIEAATDGGYPLLIKPSAGGGGKGMQVVWVADELPDALVAARRIAASAFGDDTLFLEQLIPTPRHIEVQVLADNHGAVIHLGERECSLQRRHQKVIEEAPSALLDTATRARIGEAACQAAASVDYRGAGTIEFLVSAEAPDEFFFMEMNTRLQVEHPVTELVTGLDLVEWQLRIAAGEPLAIAQRDVVLTGHAVEARVYAERPENGFLPSSGTILALHEAAGDGIRVDSSLVPGLEITPTYDPMLSKVIGWGVDRAEALGRLDAALGDTSILGVHTNIEYLRALIAEPEVQAGELDTSLIERRMPDLVFRGPDDTLLAAAGMLLHTERWKAAVDLWHRPTGWRMAGDPKPSRYSLGIGAGEAVDVLVSGACEQATIVVGDSSAHEVRLLPRRVADGIFVEIDGVARMLRVARSGDALWLGDSGYNLELTVRGRAEQLADRLAGVSRAASAANPDVRSPMPGTVVAVSAVTGDHVEAGATLLVVEAMKMEHQLTASGAGTVKINVTAGDVVRQDQIVATITSEDPPAQPEQRTA